MTKRLYLSIILAAVAILLIAVPALAACYAYIYVEESDGNSYDDLPLICACNITSLADSGFISSTGLDTRVLTGEGEALPHMLSDDKILFVSDLAAYEDKTLIFYTGATSLSDFPIIVGHDGYITTEDDADLELSYVIEALYSGLFDASAGDGKYIHYKEEAWKVSISAANTLRVAALEAGGAEQWEMHYSSFTSGEHTIYVMANGLVAYLYVDDFEVAKDTANLFDTESYQCINKEIWPVWCGYTQGYYWVFYYYDTTHFAYVTSNDGLSWSGETTIAIDTGDGTSSSHVDAYILNDYVHLAYCDGTGTNYLKYRKGELTDTPDISWCDDWQEAATDEDSGHAYSYVKIGVDNQHYPYIGWEDYTGSSKAYVTKSANNDGSWSTAAGYPWELWSVGSNEGSIKQILGFPNSNKMYLVWEWRNYAGSVYTTYANYYNGSSWEPVDNIDSYVNMNAGAMSMTADDEDNVYIGWCETLGVGGEYHPDNYLSVRYSNEVWEPPILLDEDGNLTPYPCYNVDNGVVYIIWGNDVTNYVYCCSLDTNEMEFNTAVPIVALLTDVRGVPHYENNIGFVQSDTNAFHATIDLTAYQWNNNSNNWTLMQNNVMPYADYFMVGIDGTLQLHYQPDNIIQGTTLPDEESDHDGTITWGSNPEGVDVSHSELICEEAEAEESGYYYFDPGSQDIIKPEPEVMTGDVDLERLRGNPLYPFVQILSIDGFLNERLVWLGLAWFIVIVAMFGVHLGFDTRKGTEKPQHFILTTITGLGLSILFYAMGIFGLWVVILMAFGLLAAVIWERQPVI